MHSSLAIANEFIQRARSSGRALTHMQLQKLVYLAHGWGLAVTGEALVEDEFEAWEFGPVNPKLYQALKRHGASPVAEYINWGDDTPFPADDTPVAAFEDLTPDERGVVNRVWELYGKYPAFKLSALTHEVGTPWTQAFDGSRNRPLANTAIQEYFVRLADAPT